MTKQKQDKIMVSGKRKTAIAKALIQEGTGRVTINKMPYENLPYFKKLIIQEPIEITKNTLKHFNFDIAVKVRSGGKQSRIEATRVAISRALVKFTGSLELRKEFLNYDRTLLIADVRRKEAYKPNDSKARAKRQKSYR
jgi:small subunit ribosomal protein S9